MRMNKCLVAAVMCSIGLSGCAAVGGAITGAVLSNQEEVVSSVRQTKAQYCAFVAAQPLYDRAQLRALLAAEGVNIQIDCDNNSDTVQ